ncbi:MAG: penicillin-binding protein 1A [Rhodospirillales bacterium]|nr:penicillin-binding protein 1A [Rhodospirillales bacterium]
MPLSVDPNDAALFRRTSGLKPEHQAPPSRWRRWTRRLAVGFGLAGLLGLAVGIVAVIVVLSRFGQGLPEYRQLMDYEPAETSRTYAADGQPLGRYAEQDRQFVPIRSIPEQVANAFIAAEDRNFWTHSGLDYVGIARAVVQNAGRIADGRRLIGASTITQQVAKTFLLTRTVSIERKVKEALLALRMERVLSKERVLELYLNEIYLGLRSYGVAAAARNYFDKSLDELSLAEMAYLAALPKGPNNYHPELRREAALERRAYVLRRMTEEGFVTAEAASSARAEPLTSVAREGRDALVAAPHFAEEVRRWIDESMGEEVLYQGGLTVTTTLEPSLQQIATDVLRDGLEAYDRRHGYRGPAWTIDDPEGTDWAGQLSDPGARPVRIPPHLEPAMVLEVDGQGARVGLAGGAVMDMTRADMAWALEGGEDGNPAELLEPGDVMLVEMLGSAEERQPALRQLPEVEGALVALDPRNGRVLALVGGYGEGEFGFNRATQAKRQPGSAFKPFVYLAALEDGLTPGSLVLDAPLVIDQGPHLEEWRPQNYAAGRFYGPRTLRDGLERSRNVMTIRLANTLGVERVVEVAERFGLGLPQPFLATALGTTETTPLALASAYATLLNGGRRIEPAFVERVQDRHGRTIHRRDMRRCPACGFESELPPDLPLLGIPVADPVNTFQVTWMLKGVVEVGTARRLANLGMPLAGKTGTTNDFLDAWFVGFSPNLVVCVFVGYDQPRNLGRGESGGRVAAPIFGAFMERALAQGSASPFRIPDGVDMVRIDAETGRRPAPDSQRVIFEAFARGTGPESAGATVRGFEDEIY